MEMLLKSIEDLKKNWNLGQLANENTYSPTAKPQWFKVLWNVIFLSEFKPADIWRMLLIHVFLCGLESPFYLPTEPMDDLPIKTSYLTLSTWRKKLKKLVVLQWPAF